MNKSKAWYKNDTVKTRAIARVDNHNQLRYFKDVIIDYDWDNYEEHLEWVANRQTTTEEILKWAKGIREDERSV